MGAAASSPFAATSRFFRKVADDPSAKAVATIDICLACEKDSYSPELRDMRKKKEYFRELMRGVLLTDMYYTIFRWSTWDTDNADPVTPTEDLIRARRANVRARRRGAFFSQRSIVPRVSPRQEAKTDLSVYPFYVLR